jgi:hypothetical protein
MTERQIQTALFRDKASIYTIIMPNYTPAKWFECDVFGVTKSGYFHEFEIKLTKADFEKDKEKSTGKVYAKDADGKWFKTGGVTKHGLLACGTERGPVTFTYVVPDGLLSVEDIPEFAGLQYALSHRVGAVRLRTIREPPRLHGAKCDPKIVKHAHSVSYWRFWRERCKHD